MPPAVTEADVIDRKQSEVGHRQFSVIPAKMTTLLQVFVSNEKARSEDGLPFLILLFRC